MLLSVWPFFVYGAFVRAGSYDEQFSEELLMRPLNDGKVSATFTFKTSLLGAQPRPPQSLGKQDLAQHYALFPLPLGQVLREYAITELHLTLNSGKWNYDRWGYPPESGVGTGAELWAWLGNGGSLSIDERWEGLRNALAGLFCASLGSLNNQRTTSPVQAFPPEGALLNRSRSSLRHASLASENICTENLTPFLKLLPCKSRSGLASLLNPHKLLDADWHGLGVHVTWEDHVIMAKFTVQAVLDPVRLTHRRDWSLQSLFDRQVEKTCPSARFSAVKIQLPIEQSYTLSPDAVGVPEDNIATYDLLAGDISDVAMSWPAETAFRHPIRPTVDPTTPMSFLRTLRGASQDRGQLSLSLTNNLDRDMEVLYLETLPWHLQFYLSTLKHYCSLSTCFNALRNVSYTPPYPHARPATLQITLSIPPRETINLLINVHKSFLRYTEHPPDASRGWDLPPAVLILPNGSRSSVGLQRLYTPSLLIDLATPDFSMPYNVIIMTCTLITLVFGSIFNLLMRKFVLIDLRPSTTLQVKERVDEDDTTNIEES